MPEEEDWFVRALRRKPPGWSPSWGWIEERDYHELSEVAQRYLQRARSKAAESLATAAAEEEAERVAAAKREEEAEVDVQAAIQHFAFPTDEEDTAGDLPGAATALGEEEEGDDTTRASWERRNAIVGEGLSHTPVGGGYWTYPDLQVFPKEAVERRSIHEMIDRHPLFVELPPLLREVVVDAFERYESKPGDVLATSGESEALFLLVQGSVADVELDAEVAPTDDVEVVKTITASPSASPTTTVAVATNAEGSPSSSSSMQMIVAAPKYALVAQTPTLSWRLARSEYKKILMIHFLNDVLTMKELVDTITIFDGLSFGEKLMMCTVAEVVVLPEGTKVMEAGKKTDYAYILLSGQVEVTQPLPNGLELQLRVLPSSECVGFEEVLAENGGQRASLNYTVTRGEAKVLRFSGVELNQRGEADFLRRVFPQHFVAETARRADVSRRIQSSLATRTAAPDDEDEEAFTDDMCPVHVKDEEDTKVLLDTFFSRPEYAGVVGMQRGLALAAFTASTYYPQGTTLLSAEGVDPAALCSSHGIVVEHPHPQSTDSCPPLRSTVSDIMNLSSSVMEKSAEASPTSTPWLYVLRRGAIAIYEEDDHLVTLRACGGSVGESILSQPRAASNRLTAIVSSPDGCEVYRLDRRTYRCLLLRSYMHAQRYFTTMLAALSFADGLSNIARALLCQCSSILEVDAGDVLLAAATTPRFVFAIFDGKVHVRLAEHEDEDANEEINRPILRAGDFVGALETLDGLLAPVSYTTRIKTRVLRVRADTFVDLCRSVLPMIERQRHSSRFEFYRQHGGAGGGVKALMPRPPAAAERGRAAAYR